MNETKLFSWKQLENIQARINSYLGYCKHTSSYNLKKSTLEKLSKPFNDFFILTSDFHKVTINKHFWKWHCLQNSLSIN